MTAALRHNPFDKYLEVARINYRQSITHLGNVIGSSIIILLRTWIFAQLYTATYHVAGASQIGGFSLPMVVWSLTLAQSFQSSGRPAVGKVMREEILDGSVAYTLGRPYSYLFFHYFGFIGRGLPKLCLNVIFGSCACLVLVGPIHITVPGLLLGVVLMVLGLTLDFIISFITGLFTFWMEDSYAIGWIYSKAQLVFGGVLVPLTLFPTKVQHLAERLPFSQLYASAAHMIVSFSLPTFAGFLLYQLSYILLFYLLATYMFSRVIRLVTVNGG